MRNIFVDSLKQTPLEQQKLEIVERKGLGHPDFICDAIMDNVSVRLSQEYLRKTGAILHHNIDKSLLAAGEAETRFGGGIVKKPMLLIFGDRATFEARGVKIPVEEIAIQTAKQWLKENLRFVDPEKHARYQVELKPGHPELMDIFQRKGRVLGANDTSAAVGYAPMTRTEEIVLKTENFVNSQNFKKQLPESGEDVKIMAFRKNNSLRLTMSMALVDRFVDSERDYFRKKEELSEEITRFVRENTDFEETNIDLNTLDVKGRGIGGVYLTVLGTSAEAGDSGQVGRGNRTNGVIPLNRPYCSEAAAGKNPVSHVGKIYNTLTHKLANDIYNRVPGLEEVYVWLLSQIGKPVDDPAIAAAQVVMKGNNSFEGVRKQIREVIDEELENIDKFCRDLTNGKIPIC
ncbi:MAG: methionine adenosyltransferase [Candidatus Bathyarchaeota archaeon]|nr:methionine adenosyltransferase [Candidatus Bathyarchaeota archaeon]MDH5733219.1 methionine adenosyltransferase [Candidatus Bathyarchaeota archaeon]